MNTDLAVRLDRVGGPPVFVKGVRGGGRRAMFLENEVASTAVAPGVAPAVLCRVERDDWLVVGFEHVSGRRADLSPGSADLDLVGSTVDIIGGLAAKDVRPLRLRWRQADSWQIVADKKPHLVAGWDVAAMTRWSELIPELVDGDRLLHTDLHADQFLIGDADRVRVIDWAFPAAGAAWVDTAFLVLRLIGAGHTPANAEHWAHARSSWRGIADRTVTAFAVYVAGLWSEFAAVGSQPGAEHRARLAREYAAWRLAA
jgi:hypothetical protein